MWRIYIIERKRRLCENIKKQHHYFCQFKKKTIKKLVEMHFLLISFNILKIYINKVCLFLELMCKLYILYI
ncbi:hypothetical protein HanXRQr2_Chr08g0320831 [Helianthus annuus]|uniref:Uncharacterized protein n=1 Tax=Helianthus annuus TaxID=4232 RepID=A0A9K3IBS1_HELAN|nr:hypothetical protein HanXRQr2_Chr08g0320831 [Helianthus annuus]